jgi:UDP-N-acetyl-D-glucosamine dehydrogenase
MVKLLETTFQTVNIGLANEIAVMCRALGIDVWEVIDAAASKPFGFMPFYPGPGMGGGGIRARTDRLDGFEPRFVSLAHEVNTAMPGFVVSLLAEALNDRGRSLDGSRVLVLGVTYRRDVNDITESPALGIIADLIRRGATVRYHDPYVPTLTVGDRALTSVPLDDGVLQDADSALILTDHSAVDYKRVVEAAPLVVDTRNATAGAVGAHRTIVRL